MSEEEAKGVKDQETAIPEANSEDKGPSQEAKSNQPKEGSKEYNFARLREKSEMAEKKSLALEKEIIELKKAMESKVASTLSVEEDELEKLDPDDILTVQQAKKLSEKQAKIIVQDMLEKQEKASLPEKTKVKFNDFDNVMTEENIKKLEIDEPGLAAACAKAPNPWEATYKILKKFILPSQEGKQNKGEEKMNENLSKPASVNSVGRRGPLSDANTWSEASRDDLYKEMMQSARKVR